MAFFITTLSRKSLNHRKQEAIQGFHWSGYNYYYTTTQPFRIEKRRPLFNIVCALIMVYKRELKNL